MTDSEIDSDLSFRRAMQILDRIEDPAHLIAMWRMLPCLETIPSPERITPWYKGFENLLR